MLYGPVAAALAAVEQRLVQELQSPYESLAPVLHYGTQLGGKRLRPAMLLLAGASVGELNHDHLVLGTVVEMVHTATLIHDDVLDNAQTRRHTPTINAKWDSHTSILLGDYLFAQSFRLAATLDSTEACRWIGEAARRVCEGELRQVLSRDVFELDQTSYIEMIRGKTAELCRVACMLGARYADADSGSVDALGRFGDAVGIAFQIADDFLDLWGNDQRVGKTLGTDLEQGKLTLPLIRLIQTSSPAERKHLHRVLTAPPEQRWPEIRRRLKDSDAAEFTVATAEAYRDRALRELEYLPPTPARDALRAVATFAVRRGY